MTFHQPSVWFLLALLLLPVLWKRWRSPRRRAAVAYSSAASIRGAGTTWVVRWRWIVPALRTIALALLIIAIARPRKGDEQTRINTEGLAIQLIVDRSGSMRAMDFTVDGRPTDRLTAVKRVVDEFVLGGKAGGLPGRPNDVIGMIAFASFADSVCPMTTDHAHLMDAMKEIKIATDRQEGATAIGDAIALAVERLHALELRHDPEKANAIKGKVMVLLTDGENNAGDIDPLTAAQMAAAFNIKIYTIGAGTRDGLAPIPGTNILGQPNMIPVSIDEDTLTKIAETTGGRYFRATDTDSLKRVYEQIDQLEKTKLHERRYVTYKEAAVERLQYDRITIPPLLSIVLVVLLFETLLASTRFRTTP